MIMIHFLFSQEQGVSKYTVLGWDEGAKVALLMAIRYPTEVEALVLIGITSNYNNKNLKALKDLTSLDKWPKNRVQNYLRGYDSKEEIQKQWNRYIQFVEYYGQYFPEDIFQDKIKSVDIPVLFVHGDKVSSFESRHSITCHQTIYEKGVTVL